MHLARKCIASIKFGFLRIRVISAIDKIEGMLNNHGKANNHVITTGF
jgi:hypothetical protein